MIHMPIMLIKHNVCKDFCPGTYLFLGTVADAQGLSYYADAALWQRLALSGAALHQARQALLTRGLVASQRPLYQGLALDTAPQGAMPRAAPVAADDDPGDIKAVFARIWEGLG